MVLHHDKEAFGELIIGAANELHIPANVIEKDYFVTLALKELSTRLTDMVFKGGTSLTKCYQLLDRFSEDIDITYTAESGIPGDARKRKLKQAVIDTMDALGLTINNLDKTRSRRHFNCYRASYPSIYDEYSFLKPELVVETYIALLSFPTVTRMVDNYLYRFLEKIDALHIVGEYELMPFPITTQAIERTFVDKIYAVCDYYLEGKTDRHSRHLYDIHKIYNHLELTGGLSELITDVRAVRSELSICPSAQDGVSINALLTEIIEMDIYKRDYKDITENLLFTPLAYEEVLASLKAVVDSGIFY